MSFRSFQPNRGTPNGFASLDSAGHLPLAQFPGQEIAYAEYTAGTLLVPAAVTQIPGLQIVIPAGTGPYVVEFSGTNQATATAVNGVAIIDTEIVDEGGVVLDTARCRCQIPVSGQVWEMRALAKRRMPATPVAKTIKAMHAATVASATPNLLSGPGNATAVLAPGPVYLTAYLR